jgi:hypothetical protein
MKKFVLDSTNHGFIEDEDFVNHYNGYYILSETKFSNGYYALNRTKFPDNPDNIEKTAISSIIEYISNQFPEVFERVYDALIDDLIENEKIHIVKKRIVIVVHDNGDVVISE